MRKDNLAIFGTDQIVGCDTITSLLWSEKQHLAVAALMVDTLTEEARSALMAKVRGRDTKPELIVRRTLHALGYRFRLQAKELPGRPDIVMRRRRKAIFVHGCFWHRHTGCRLTRMPKTRTEFWAAKFEANIARDNRAMEALVADGWRVLVVWECQTKPDRIEHLPVLLECFVEDVF